MFEHLKINSPKRDRRSQTGWEGFFPYYAGYPETFASTLLSSANLRPDAVVCDPWNGSGTTTYAASTLGFNSRGFDINPAMVVIARARLLPASEADSVEPVGKEIMRLAHPTQLRLRNSDPLELWFSYRTAASIRSIERSIGRHLLGEMTITKGGTNLDKISGLAATFYVALFTVCRRLAAPFRSSNPTWLRIPKLSEEKIDVPHREVTKILHSSIRGMAQALSERAEQSKHEFGASEIRLLDTASVSIAPKSADFVLTSPPYCTRIDYTAATRIELAIMDPLIRPLLPELGRRMVGSIRVPITPIEISPEWGRRCARFLQALRRHPSKASAGYYYKTHLDYFDKMNRSIQRLSSMLRIHGQAVMVVQDSYYKEIHNDVPSIVVDIAEAHGLKLGRRDNFHLQRSMSGINPHTRIYQRPAGAVESVLCFHK